MKWKIYYGDDTIFSSDEGDHFSAPGQNVQAIIQEDDDHGWMSQANSDYYIWASRGDNFRWYGVDIFGLFDYLLETGLVKFGRTISKNKYQSVMNKALNDPDFRKKTGFHKSERICEQKTSKS